MNSLDLLGLIATCFTTSSFIPQVWQIWKTRDVSAISLPTYLIITFGIGLWLIYGILRGDMPIIVANGLLIVLTGAIAIMKIRYSKKP